MSLLMDWIHLEVANKLILLSLMIERRKRGSKLYLIHTLLRIINPWMERQFRLMVISNKTSKLTISHHLQLVKMTKEILRLAKLLVIKEIQEMSKLI